MLTGLQIQGPQDTLTRVPCGLNQFPSYGGSTKMNWKFWLRPFGSYVFLWMALGLFSLTILLMAGALLSRERDLWVNHSLDVLQNLERYEASIMAAQMRASDSGPVSLNSAANRQRAEARISAALQSADTLLVLTADNNMQSVRVRVLKSLTEQIAARFRSQVQAPPMLGVPLENIVFELPVVETINEIRTAERSLLDQNRAKSASADNIFWALTTIALILNLLIVWWAYQASRRYVEERNQTEFEVRYLNARLADEVAATSDLNSSLENRVAEKTGQLQDAVARLKGKNKELERFAYIASHDMQEPLRQVASFNNLLSLKYGNQLDATAGRYLEYSVAGAKRLQLMLRGLLQYTVTTPEGVHPVEVPAGSMIKSVLAELQPEIHAASASIAVDCPDGLTILGDREMLSTVALSLVSNALKFRDNQVPTVVHIAFERHADYWSMTVTDNGIGVDERFASRMFEMFARFHALGEHPGAGVGLALSKRIVDCHGGTLTVRPNPDPRGSVFTVTVPIRSDRLTSLNATGRFPY